MTVSATYVKVVSIDGTEIPGMTGNLKITANVVEDTNFLTNRGFHTKLIGLQEWGVDGSGKIGQDSGYTTTIKNGGTATAMTAEATALVSGKTYQIVDVAKRVIDDETAIVVYDGAVDHTADVESVDYLFGTVTFTAAYTVSGAITIDGKYLPLAAVAQYKGFLLSLKGDKLDATTSPDAQANGGTRVNAIGLIDGSGSISRLDDLADTFIDLLTARTPMMVEIVSGDLTLRGWFVLTASNKSGDVKGLETEEVQLSLVGRPGLTFVGTNFSYAAAAGLNAGITALLAAFLARSTVELSYAPDGSTAKTGNAYVESLDFSGDNENVDDFKFALVSAGALS